MFVLASGCNGAHYGTIEQMAGGNGQGKWPCDLTLDLLNIFSENMKIYLHFLSLPDTEMEQVVEIFPPARQGPMAPT